MLTIIRMALKPGKLVVLREDGAAHARALVTKERKIRFLYSGGCMV